MNFVHLLLTCFVAWSCSFHHVTPTQYDLDQDFTERRDISNDIKWGAFKDQFNKSYSNEKEETERKEVFVENLWKINRHNDRYGNGQETFQMGMNAFGDWTEDEFDRFADCAKMPDVDKSSGKFHGYNASFGIPRNVDWRNQQAVTSVKYQGQCGACYAFSVVGALEGLVSLKLKKPAVSLSAQNVIDCSSKPPYKNLGCFGGSIKQSYAYIIGNKGVDTDASYPYKAKEGNCEFNRDNVGGTMRFYHFITQNDENELESAVAYVGPVSVHINAIASVFQFYKSGVIGDDKCHVRFSNPPRPVPKHTPLVVGYTPKFWILKNSWGERWGDKGYFYLRRHKNTCNIAESASFPYD